MGKAGRFVCVFIPMVLTIASLIFQIMVGLGGTNANNSYLSNIYFLQANTTAAAHNSSLINMPANNQTDPLDKTASGKIIFENFYAIGLWGYCAGSGANTTSSVLAVGQSTARSVDFCTAKQLHFAFDPATVWGLNSTMANNLFDKDLQNTLTWYAQTASKWISTLYIIAVVATAVEILIGIGGLFSRLGSLFTTLASVVTSIFLWSFAILATATYVGLGGAFNVALKQYGITFYIGTTMFIYMWLAVACSLVSGIFWAFSCCCCSGRSREPAYNKAAMAERTPYTYERVDGPYAQNHAAPLNNVGGRPTAYEPFRHGN
ncbi:hypothetical protein MMC19_000883 [Ptychographa xylographoides]|nr:hypothetical protein [Ptychographa xylographoides]